jgi:hypothetical protein
LRSFITTRLEDLPSSASRSRLGKIFRDAAAHHSPDDSETRGKGADHQSTRTVEIDLLIDIAGGTANIAMRKDDTN